MLTLENQNTKRKKKEKKKKEGDRGCGPVALTFRMILFYYKI
jgi:hypothetical protein